MLTMSIHREKKALHTSYRCGRDNLPLMDRMCEQLQPHYDYTKDWQPTFRDFLLSKDDGGDRLNEVKGHERAEYLYELLREQLNRETAVREEKQSKMETELGQVWNTTLSRIKKTYSQLGSFPNSLCMYVYPLSSKQGIDWTRWNQG